jgi:hypothetical protein
LCSNSILTYSDSYHGRKFTNNIPQSSQRNKLHAESSEKKVFDENREMENIDKDEIDIEIKVPIAKLTPKVLRLHLVNNGYI